MLPYTKNVFVIFFVEHISRRGIYFDVLMSQLGLIFVIQFDAGI